MFGKNLKYYRLKKNMTKKELAEACDITPMSITHYESGSRRPSMEVIEKLAEALDVNISDFIASRNETLIFSHDNFRKTSALSKGKQEYIKEAVEEYFNRLFDAADCVGGNPLPERPDISKNKPSGDYEADANFMRKSLQLPEGGPIPNLIAALEARGYLVVEVDFDESSFSGRTGSVNGYPYIAINKNVNTDRKRSTIAHELEHIFFEELSEENEQYATAVGGAFLIPKEDLYKKLGLKRKKVTGDFLLICKEYGISTQLLVKRASQAGIISTSVERDFFFRLSRDGWRKKEPEHSIYPEESIQLRQLVLRAINEGNITIQKGAELLHTSYNDVAKGCSEVV